jgi:RNA polymerase-binding transcription factor DksA
LTESLNMEMMQQMLEVESERLRQRSQKSSGNGRTESKDPDLMGMAQSYSDQERTRAIQILEQEHIDLIAVALKAIAESSYGRCQHCHKPIPLERLQAPPYATMCVSCQTQHG